MSWRSFMYVEETNELKKREPNGFRSEWGGDFSGIIPVQNIKEDDFLVMEYIVSPDGSNYLPGTEKDLAKPRRREDDLKYITLETLKKNFPNCSAYVDSIHE